MKIVPATSNEPRKSKETFLTRKRVKTSLKCLFTGTMVVLQSRASLNNFVFKMKNEERPFLMIGQPLPEARQTLTVPRSSSKKCQHLYKRILQEPLSASEVIGIGAGSSYRPNYDSTTTKLRSAIARPSKTLVFRFSNDLMLDVVP